MHFTSAIATAILAYTVAAAPPYESKSETYSAPSSTYSSSYSAPSSYSSSYETSASQTHETDYATKTYESTAAATATKPLADLGLSKTAQIFLSDTRADAINNVLQDNSDFVFKFLEKAKPNANGAITAANRKTFPALTGTGIGAALGQLGPCGFNTPHVHPRATELLFQIEGRVVSSMFPENGVNLTDGTPREILNTINPFESTVYFQGSVHSQFNPDCTNATFFAALSSEDFGVGQVAQELFGTSDDAIAAVYGNAIDGADVEKLRGIISKNVAQGVEQCLVKCNIPKRR